MHPQRHLTLLVRFLVAAEAARTRHGLSNNEAEHGRRVARSRCSFGIPLCTLNNVSVLETRTADGRSQRRMQFGDECATESTVFCKSGPACGLACNPCPCDFDSSAGLSVNYMKTMFQNLGAWCTRDNTHVLMIGLGGGELSQYLLHHCPGMSIDAVELSGSVISMAKAYFGLTESAAKFKGRLAIEQADALTAVAERALSSSEAYAVVLVDCFSGRGEVPESCRSRAFAEKVQAILKPGGVLLQNIWHYSRMSSAVPAEFEEAKRIYKDVFGGELEDLEVPMPPRLRWVDVLKATKAAAGPQEP